MNYEKLMSKKNSDGKDAVDFLNEASDLMDKDNFKNASSLLTEAIGLCGHPRLYFNRGYCYHQMKDYKKATGDFKKGIANDRGSDLLGHEKQRLYLYLGIIYEETGERDNAVDSYKKAADWGYAGAIARLEKMGVDYIPQDPMAKSLKTEDAPAKQHTQKNTLESKSVSGAKSKSAADSQRALSSNLSKTRSKFRFILPVAIGVIFGAGAFLLLQNLPEKTSAVQTVNTSETKAVVISDTLYLRAEPYANADVLKVLYNGYVLEITGDVSGSFTPVEYEGLKGWVDSDRIDFR